MAYKYSIAWAGAWAIAMGYRPMYNVCLADKVVALKLGTVVWQPELAVGAVPLWHIMIECQSHAE